MRIRTLSSVLIALSTTVLACEDDHGGYDGNEIVFGIEQRTSIDGTRQVTASYEFLRLAGRGGSAPYVFRDGDGEGTCYFEQLVQRLGRPRVDNGAATFSGAKLPGDGLHVLANQADPSHAGVGWEDGDVLTFSASGFAMPTIDAVRLFGPRSALEITAIAPAPATGSEMTIKAGDAVGVTWKPVSVGPASYVMVALDTDEGDARGSQVRCYGTSESGSAVLPSAWVARLFSAVDPKTTLKGTLRVASHRQVTVLSRGHWTTYVVATTLHESRTWTGVR